MDFAGADGWRMYHGSTFPASPQHPHRGFETVTFVRQGFVDHSDSLGATARFGRGDVQWLTAGKGIVHCEMFPLLDRTDRTRASCSRSGSTCPPPTRWSSRTSRCCGARIFPRHVVTDDAGPRDRDHGHRGRARRAASAAAAARFVGVAPRGRPRDLASRARARRRVGHPARGRARHRAHVVRLRRRRAHRRPRARSVDRRGAARRRSRAASRAVPTARRRSCSRAARSANRSRSTARS